jgi:hypothetical protein
MAKSQTTNPQYKSAASLFSDSYNIVKRNLNLFALLYFVPLALAVADTIQELSGHSEDAANNSHWLTLFNPTGSSSSIDTASWPGSIVFILLLAVALLITSLMLVIAQTRTAQGKTLTLAQTWQDFKKLGLKILGVEILMGLSIVAGFILFIIPGIYIMGRVYLAPYLLVDKNVGITDAIKGSWNLTKGRMWPVYGVLLFTILLGLTGILPVVGPLVSGLLTAAYSVAPALRYFELKKA